MTKKAGTSGVRAAGYDRDDDTFIEVSRQVCRRTQRRRMSKKKNKNKNVSIDS